MRIHKVIDFRHSPVETKPLLAFVPASSIVEAGSPRLLAVDSSQEHNIALSLTPSIYT
ncbi:MAG: hypothetical protein QW265_03535 [Candidatus Bathyarchaeia archaeon]